MSIEFYAKVPLDSICNLEVYVTEYEGRRGLWISARGAPAPADRIASFGAVWGDIRKERNTDKLFGYVMQLAMQLVVEYRLPIDLVHLKMKAIAEYRQAPWVEEV